MGVLGLRPQRHRGDRKRYSVNRLRAIKAQYSLRQATHDILATAHAALNGLNTEDPSCAIHDFRIAIKRWRALLRLLKESLGEETVVLRREGLVFSREFGRSRDARAALDALTSIIVSKRVDASSISKRTFATITNRLEQVQKSSETAVHNAKSIQHIRDGVVHASNCAAAWPLEDIKLEKIIIGLTRSYRRARRRLPSSWTKVSPDEIHRFRKALVTFHYQLELIEPLWPKVSRRIIKQLQRVRLQLGKSNDLVILSQLMRPKKPMASWRSRLTPLIEGQKRFHIKQAEVLVGRLFLESPRSFQKRFDQECRTG